MSWMVASSSAKPKPASCLPAGTKLVSHAGLARVFRWYDDGYACRPGVPPVMLGSFYSEGNLSACNVDMAMVRLVSRYVAWREESYCQNAFGWTVHVRRIAKHTKTRSYDTGARPLSDVLIDYGVGPARQIALDTHGRLAWIAQDHTVATPTYEVWRIVRGKPVRLARGTAIDPRRLRIIGHQARWFQADQRRLG